MFEIYDIQAPPQSQSYGGSNNPPQNLYAVDDPPSLWRVQEPYYGDYSSNTNNNNYVPAQPQVDSYSNTQGQGQGTYPAPGPVGPAPYQQTPAPVNTFPPYGGANPDPSNYAPFPGYIFPVTDNGASPGPAPAGTTTPNTDYLTLETTDYAYPDYPESTATTKMEEATTSEYEYPIYPNYPNPDYGSTRETAG